jgi:hypothetical protein
MDFFEVTGGRVLSFRNVSVGEPAGPDLSGQCGGLLARRASRSERAKLPHGYVAEKTSPGAPELKKSPSSLDQEGLCKGLYSDRALG